MEQLSFKLQVFEGPLDLLLHLIQKNKVNIYDIPIFDITNQYIDYLKSMEEMDLEISSEFSLMASKLLYIKSKMLLPKYDEEEADDPRRELVDRLVEYQRIKSVKEKLRAMQFAGTYSYYRLPEKIEEVAEKKHIESADISKLIDAFNNILERIERKAPPPKENFDGIVGREPVSVQDMADNIVKRIIRKKRVKFKEFFKGAKHKNEVVAIFLAVLELLKLNKIYAEDDGKNLIFREVEEINEN